MKILFVCTGNTCRSPMAAALVKRRVPEAEVESAGIFAGHNQRASQKTIVALKNYDIELEHKSQPVTDALLNWADIVLTMTTQHKQSLIMEFPNFQDKYFTLKEYVSDADKKIWDELKQKYADYEEKRAMFIKDNGQKLDNNHLNRELESHLAEDIEHIKTLEASLLNYDISDPFGGAQETYEKTLQELSHYIDLLKEKINK
ncbi:low molecular weight protein arginine phosphatase [Virgibacillus oceani]